MDADRIPVIAEVKLDYLDHTLVRQSIGQILQYVCAYIRGMRGHFIPDSQKLSDVTLRDASKILRLFIVGTDPSQPVENICQFLRAHGINLRYISIHDKIELERDTQ